MLKFLASTRAGPVGQSVVCLTLAQKVACLSLTASRLTRPSIPRWVNEMSTRWMMVIGRTCAFQIVHYAD